MLLLGFWMAVSAAAPLDDALAELDRLEARRERILAEADSVGRAIASLPAGPGAEVGRLLSAAERLSGRVQELDLEILLALQRCRSLAVRELERLQGSTDPRAFASEEAIHDLLDRRLADRWGTEPVLVEPDSLDGYETLLDKQAYLADLRDRVAALSNGLSRRIDSVRREERLLRASERFADEARFLDEGGRLGSGDRIPLRGVPGEDPPGEGAARARPSAGAGNDPEAAPADRFSAGPRGEGLLETLEAARGRLEQDLNRVAEALRATEDLLDRYETPDS